MAVKRDLKLQKAGNAPVKKKRGTNRVRTLADLGIVADSDAAIAALTPEEVSFAILMVESGFNRERSWREAFRKPAGAHGVSQVTAVQSAFRLMQKDGVRRLMRLLAEKTMAQVADNIDARILAVYVERAFYDIRDFYKPDGTILPIDQIPEERRCVIDGVEKKCYGKDADVEVVTYKLASRSEALKMLNDYAALVRDPRLMTGRTVVVEDDAGEDEDLAAKYAAMDADELERELRAAGGAV